jgi:hypothetical protein
MRDSCHGLQLKYICDIADFSSHSLYVGHTCEDLLHREVVVANVYTILLFPSRRSEETLLAARASVRHKGTRSLQVPQRNEVLSPTLTTWREVSLSLRRRIIARFSIGRRQRTTKNVLLVKNNYGCAFFFNYCTLLYIHL